MATPAELRANFIYLSLRDKEDCMPPSEETSQWSNGTNIQPWGATSDILNRFHANGQIVGVWIDKKITKDEGPALWRQLDDLKVDAFCTDHPLEAIQALEVQQ